MEKEEVERILEESVGPVRQLAEWALSVLTSPYYEGYITLNRQLNTWSSELSENPVSIKSEEGDDMKAFEKAHKYIDKMDEFYDKLSYFRSKLTQNELKTIEATSEIDEVRRLMKNGSKK